MTVLRARFALRSSFIFAYFIRDDAARVSFEFTQSQLRRLTVSEQPHNFGMFLVCEPSEQPMFGDVACLIPSVCVPIPLLTGGLDAADRKEYSQAIACISSGGFEEAGRHPSCKCVDCGCCCRCSIHCKSL